MMILGLPVSSWVLLIVSVGLGLAIEVTFYLRRRRRPDDLPTHPRNISE